VLDELVAQGGAAGVADVVGDVLDRQVGRLQQFLGLVEALTGEPGVR
jgi:hypothetical protein